VSLSTLHVVTSNVIYSQIDKRSATLKFHSSFFFYLSFVLYWFFFSYLLMFPSSSGGDHKGKGCDVGFVTGNKKEGGGG
jgi:hypothetical protein